MLIKFNHHLLFTYQLSTKVNLLCKIQLTINNKLIDLVYKNNILYSLTLNVNSNTYMYLSINSYGVPYAFGIFSEDYSKDFQINMTVYKKIINTIKNLT